MSDEERPLYKLDLSEKAALEYEEKKQLEFFDRYLRPGLEKGTEAGVEGHTLYRSLIRAAVVVSLDVHGEAGFEILEEAVEYYVNQNKERYAKGWR